MRNTVARRVLGWLNLPIKRCATFLAFLMLAHAAAAGGDFFRTLTPEEIQSTGLAKLTPDELAQLEALVQRYKAGAIAAAPAVAKAQEPKPPPKPAMILPEWVGALITLERTSQKPDKSDAMNDHIKGDFSGWSGRTTFRLDNGQLWTQANGDSYIYSPTLKSPKVKIYPASFGSFWLEIEGVNQRCRVKPVKLE